MDSPQKEDGKILEVGRLKLSDGWEGLVCLSDTAGKRFSIEDWEQCLASPGSILENYEKVLKKEPPLFIVQKNLAIGGETLSVVAKYDTRRAGLLGWLRSLRPSKAAGNFRTACRLLENDIQAAVPVAAVYKRKSFSVVESIYITEYIEGSVNLYHFLKGQLLRNKSEQYAIKKQLAEQIANILAGLHKSGLWHRDAKAGNFIVCPDSNGQYIVKLVDMDGIKRYTLNRSRRQLQSLWRLAASLVGIVTRSDFLRTFNLYCNLCGLQEERRRIYRRLVLKAKAKWLLNSKKCRWRKAYQ